MSQPPLGLSICWRGPPGSGKRYALQQQLSMWAKSIGQLYVLKRQLWNAPSQGGEGDDDDDEPAEKDHLPMEMSVLHWGFDCARMSLQDKKYVKVILDRFGRGSQVLSSSSSTNTQRCLVFYHAHLLSSESIIYLQAFLEENYKDCVLWLTSEYPLPPRLADWCIELPVPNHGRDRSLEKLLANPSHVSLTAANMQCTIRTPDEDIVDIYKVWMATEPKLSDVKKIRDIVYGLLHRNIRWTDGFHMWMFTLDKLPLTPAQKKACATICIQQPFTGSGQTVPSYRIPVLWEHYLIRIRNALAPPTRGGLLKTRSADELAPPKRESLLKTQMQEVPCETSPVGGGDPAPPPEAAPVEPLKKRKGKKGDHVACST